MKSFRAGVRTKISASNPGGKHSPSRSSNVTKLNHLDINYWVYGLNKDYFMIHCGN